MEEGLMGGGHYECEKCGKTVFGSAIHYCEKEKIKVEHKGDIKEFLSGETKMDKSLSESILNLYKTVTGKQDANYKDIVKEFCENSSDPIGDLMWKGEIKMDKPQFTKEQLLEIYRLATDGDFNYFKNAMKYEKYDNDKTYEGPRCIYVDLKENMKPQFTEEQAREYIRTLHPELSRGEIEALIILSTQAGYIVPVKSEKPLIVHNVMAYKGKNYLRQSNIGCNECAFHGIECYTEDSIMAFGYKTDCAGTNTIWKSFDDIQITDELACSRKDIGDVYITNDPLIPNHKNIGKLIAVLDGSVYREGFENYWKGYVRLANTEELREYFKDKK